LRAFSLLGGDQAVRQPCRTALGLLWAAFGEPGPPGLERLPAVRRFTVTQRRVLGRMWRKGLKSPRTSSVGRLFDGVSSLLDLCHEISFEGQAAAGLEHVCEQGLVLQPYSYTIEKINGLWIADWRPMIRQVVADIQSGRSAAEVAARFHQTLIAIAAAMTAKASCPTVVLTGGCFQNAFLLEGVVRALRGQGRSVYWPQQFPPNDGGLALGQVWLGR